MTGNLSEEPEDELAAAYRDASGSAKDLKEEWHGTSNEAWDELE